MQVFELFADVAGHFFDWHGTHLICQLGLHGLWSLVQEIRCEIVIRLIFRSRFNSLLVDHADVDQTSLSHENHLETFSYHLVHLVFVLASMLIGIPKVTLYLWHDSAHRREEWSKSHFISVARVDWFSRI